MTPTTFAESAVKTEAGVVYKGFTCTPVVEQCEGCERTQEFEGETYCTSYAQPEKKWSLGACNFATHVKAEVSHGKVKINPLKASKRAARGR